MGSLTEAVSAERGLAVTREEQDAFAASSHQRAAAAQKNGVFDDEVVPVVISQRKGDPVLVTADEGCA
jgi:acetyl-CoA C-acetyltransferase